MPTARRCVLDGEIVCLDPHGKPQFRDLLFRRSEPLFYAFDILWDAHSRSVRECQHREGVARARANSCD